jgi:hypothetical protein
VGCASLAEARGCRVTIDPDAPTLAALPAPSHPSCVTEGDEHESAIDDCPVNPDASLPIAASTASPPLPPRSPPRLAVFTETTTQQEKPPTSCQRGRSPRSRRSSAMQGPRVIAGVAVATFALGFAARSAVPPPAPPVPISAPGAQFDVPLLAARRLRRRRRGVHRPRHEERPPARVLVHVEADRQNDRRGEARWTGRGERRPRRETRRSLRTREEDGPESEHEAPTGGGLRRRTESLRCSDSQSKVNREQRRRSGAPARLRARRYRGGSRDGAEKAFTGNEGAEHA